MAIELIKVRGSYKVRSVMAASVTKTGVFDIFMIKLIGLLLKLSNS